jgi:hypothetical protein
MNQNELLLNHKNGNLTEHALHIFKNNNNSKVAKTKNKNKTFHGRIKPSEIEAPYQPVVCCSNEIILQTN